MVSKPRKAQPPPSVRLERKATEPTIKPKTKTAASAPKIKSQEFVNSSDESDIDAEGEVTSSPPVRAQKSPSPIHRKEADSEDEQTRDDSDDDGGLQIEVPDARPPRPGNGALASLGLGQNLGMGLLRSPSNGPISLASATNSVEGSPNPHALASRNNHRAHEEIDFGDLGGDEDAEGEDEDIEEDYNNRDIEPMDIGPPARSGTTTGSADRKTSIAAPPVEDDEDDLERAMMEGLAGDSSEESEEE